MKIQPIDIEIKNNRKFGLVALLVDRADFLADIYDIRDKIKLTKIPYNLPKYKLPETDYITNAYKKGAMTINYARMMLQEECYRSNIINLYHLDKTLGSASIFSESLLKKYKKSQLYFPVIFASILVGKIFEDDFRSTFLLELEPKDIPKEVQIADSDEKVATIVVFRESIKEDVLQTYDFIQKYHFGTKKTDVDDKLASVMKDEITDEKLQRASPQIKRDRKWYWLNHKINPNRLGYERISRKESVNMQTVRSGINFYRNLLNSPL